jgi:hypothetical protein
MRISRRYYLIGSCLVLALLGSGLIYVLNKASARENLYRLAQIPHETPFDPNVVREDLLRLVPVGTGEQDVYAFLEQHGAVNAVRSSVGAITYFQKDAANVIHCFVVSDQGRIGYVGDQFHIRFILDDHGTLADITVEDASRSL